MYRQPKGIGGLEYSLTSSVAEMESEGRQKACRVYVCIASMTKFALKGYAIESQCKTMGNPIGGPIAMSRVQLSFVPEPTADGHFAISIKEIYDE
jgi:hypothetical protein